MPEEPIVITGGSVSVDLSDSFKEQPNSPGKKKYKRDKGRLTRVEVDGQAVGGSNPREVIVYYDPDAQ